MGGVINIITGAGRGVDLNLSDGSYGDRDARVALGDGRVGFSFERHVATNDYAYPALTYGGRPIRPAFGPTIGPSRATDA